MRRNKSSILKSIFEEPTSPRSSTKGSPKSMSFMSTASKDPRDRDRDFTVPEEPEEKLKSDYKRANTFNEYTYDSKWADVNTDDDFYCFSPRNTERPKHNYLSCGAASRPHPDKIDKGGEDSYFFNQNLLVIADGVGSWNDLGIDPKQHSKELCQSFQTMWEKDSELYQESAKLLFMKAADITLKSGSSTCCSVVLNLKTNTISSAYMGDVGYLIIRQKKSGEIEEVFSSAPHLKGFNYPYQVGVNCDPPELAQSFIHEVQNNDIIVMGSDGLFDNLSNQEIIKFLKPFFKNKIFRIKEAVEGLATLAKTNSSKLFFISPFAKNSVKNWSFKIGGKPDDITVLLAQVHLKML